METFLQQFPVVFHALNVGFLQTLRLFAVTLLGAIPLGLIIMFGSTSSFKPLSLVTNLFVWVIRGTPLMIQLLIIYYFPGLVMKVTFWPKGESGRFAASAVAFIVNYACYFSEIYRGGIQSIPVGQREAGQVLGLTRSQIFFQVTLLQMVKRIVPPMSNEVITLVKDTSLARVIAITEITKAGEAFMKSAGITWPLFYTAVFYLAFVGILTILFHFIERKLSYFR